MVSRKSGGASDGAAEDDSGGGPCESVPDDGTEGEETAAVRAWAREWARRLPRWSDEQWRSINAALGHRVRERGRDETREPP
jgi:hypothetical protein